MQQCKNHFTQSQPSSEGLKNDSVSSRVLYIVHSRSVPANYSLIHRMLHQHLLDYIGKFVSACDAIVLFLPHSKRTAGSVVLDQEDKLKTATTAVSTTMYPSIKQSILTLWTKSTVNKRQDYNAATQLVLA